MALFGVKWKTPPGGKIANGELYGEVTNHGEIAGWKFYGKVTNDTDGLITSGEFYGEVVNNGIISYGKFYGDVVNNGTITGGSFFGTLTGGEIQDNAYIGLSPLIPMAAARSLHNGFCGDKRRKDLPPPTKDGYTFIGWYNKADLQYINLPEWNFDYPVFENMELVAQWMEARPISTDPITYLDKDGNQQVCTAYTVLTSETKAKHSRLCRQMVRSARRLVCGGGQRDHHAPLGHPRRGQSDLNERQPPHGGVGHRCKGGRYLYRLRPKHR